MTYVSNFHASRIVNRATVAKVTLLLHLCKKWRENKFHVLRKHCGKKYFASSAMAWKVLFGLCFMENNDLPLVCWFQMQSHWYKIMRNTGRRNESVTLENIIISSKNRYQYINIKVGNRDIVNIHINIKPKISFNWSRRQGFIPFDSWHSLYFPQK